MKREYYVHSNEVFFPSRLDSLVCIFHSWQKIDSMNFGRFFNPTICFSTLDPSSHDYWLISSMHIDRLIAGIRFWFLNFLCSFLFPFVLFSFPLFCYFIPSSLLFSFSCLFSSSLNSSVESFYIFLAPCQSSRNVVTTFIKLCGRAKFLRSLKFIRTRFIGIARKIGNRKRYNHYSILRYRKEKWIFCAD